jgi:hypothetical protein
LRYENKLVKAAVAKSPAGIQNLFMVDKDGMQVEADWVRFE